MTQKKVITKKTPTPENTEAPADEDLAFLKAHGISVREVALLDRVAHAISEVRAGIVEGDEERVRAVYPDLLKLSVEAEKVRCIARKAISPRIEG